MRKTLLLFDIDGTLIHLVGKSGITYKRFTYAVNKTFGTNLPASAVPDYGHIVNTELLLLLSQKAGISRKDALRKLGTLYHYTTEHFRDHLSEYRTTILSGVKPLLSRLKGEGYMMGIVTGNIEPIAQMKMSKMGLDGIFDFGVFADGSNRKKDMILQAIKKANSISGRKFTPKNTLYFGDTAIDVQEARHASVKMLALATGHHAYEILRKESPDYLLENLSNTSAVMRIIDRIESRSTPRIFVLGRPNTTLTIPCERFPNRLEQVRAAQPSTSPGGKGLNQAVAAKRLGGSVYFVTCIGTDNFGLELLNFINKEKINTNHVKTAKGPSGLSLVFIDKGSGNTIISIPGSESMLTKDDINKVKFRRNDIAISQLSPSEAIVRHFLSRAKSKGAITLLNAAPKSECSRKTLVNADYVVVNEFEAAYLAGRIAAPASHESAIAYAKMIRSGYGQTVIVTLGHKGSVALSGEERVRINGIKVKAVDTQAAGDTFVGAFAVGLSENMDLYHAMDFANSASALAVQRLGATPSIPKRSDLSAA